MKRWECPIHELETRSPVSHVLVSHSRIAQRFKASLGYKSLSWGNLLPCKWIDGFFAFPEKIFLPSFCSRMGFEGTLGITLTPRTRSLFARFHSFKISSGLANPVHLRNRVFRRHLFFSSVSCEQSEQGTNKRGTR